VTAKTLARKIRCAVIGAGWWGTTAHIPALLAHPNAELVAVQHQDPDQAHRIARDFDVPHGCATVEQVLALDGLDAVVVSSTPNAHYSQAKAALERGLHVLIEKPMAIAAREAMELVELAAAGSLHLLIGAPWHYSDHAREARRLVACGALGQLKMISIMMSIRCLGLYRGQAVPKGENYAAPGLTSYSDPAIAGGGNIYCQVSHAAAFMAFLTAREPIEVYARFDNHDCAVDVHNTLNIKLDDGTLVCLASTGAPTGPRNHEVRAFGTDGMLFLDLFLGTMCYWDGSGTAHVYPDLDDLKRYDRCAPTKNLVDLVRGEADNGSPGTLGAAAVKVIEAACRSAQTNRNVQVAEIL
jgi:predicted dehydrogenase